MSTKVAAAGLLAAVVLAGCGASSGGKTTYTPNSEEQKLVNELAKESPEKQIERIQNGPMPEAAKAEAIRKIKAEHGIK